MKKLLLLLLLPVLGFVQVDQLKAIATNIMVDAFGLLQPTKSKATINVNMNCFISLYKY